MNNNVKLEDLVELYADVQNMFENLTPSRIKRMIHDDVSVLKKRRDSISQTLVDMIDVMVLKKTNLRVGDSPFVADSREILKQLNDGD